VSDYATCDFCKKDGRRPRMHPCPRDWFYLEAQDDEDESGENVIIVLACSKECALALFSKGPGPRFDMGKKET